MQNQTLIGEKKGKFHIGWNEQQASIVVNIEGFWSGDDMQEFLPLARSGIAKSHARNGDALMLIDLTNSEVMAGALFTGFLENGTKPTRPSDRVAIVLKSSILRLQMKRITAGDENTEFFGCRESASAWLYHIHTAV